MRILVADDDPVSCRLVQQQLTRWGYEVLAVPDGTRAWEILSAPESPKLSILDWMMPGMTGVEICRRLRQLHDPAYVYVILLTGRTEKSDMIAGLLAGADDYLCKPFLPVELQCRLQTGSRILRLQEKLIAACDNLIDRATRDGLTGTWNRPAICEKLRLALERSDFDGSTIGAAFADIDHFKLINDTRGHLVGDEALVEVASRLKMGLHPDHRLGRYGGDEFLIVFSGCYTREKVLKIAEGLRKRISQSPIHAPGGSVSASISMGVTIKEPACRCPIELLLHTADRALYQAKANGRNRVEFLACSCGERQPIAGLDLCASTNGKSACLVDASP